MRSRRTKQRWGMSHYIVGLVAVLAAVAIWVMGQDTQWALVTGWAVTSGAVFGGGIIYVLEIGNRDFQRYLGNGYLPEMKSHVSSFHKATDPQYKS